VIRLAGCTIKDPIGFAGGPQQAGRGDWINA
jgi:hypothetical protein